MTSEDSTRRQEMSPLANPEIALRHEVEAVAERFPDTDVAVVEAAIHEVYAELRTEAEVETHLIALTRHRVYDRLQEQGHEFRPLVADTESDQVGDVVSDAGSDTGLRAGSGREPRVPAPAPTPMAERTD